VIGSLNSNDPSYLQSFMAGKPFGWYYDMFSTESDRDHWFIPDNSREMKVLYFISITGNFFEIFSITSCLLVSVRFSMFVLIRLS